MLFVRQKTFDKLSCELEELRDRYATMLLEHRELVSDSDGLRLTIRALRSQVEVLSNELYVLKGRAAREVKP